MFTIKNHVDGEIVRLERDVATEHPDWVHQQMATKSESELQNFLDQISDADYAGKGRDICGIGFDES